MWKATWMLVAVGAALLGAAPAAQAQRTVTCESIQGRQNLCRVSTSGGVRLVRQFSDSPCREGRTWWASREGIWVTAGCRAQFVVGDDRFDRDGRSGRDDRYGRGGRDDRWDDRRDRDGAWRNPSFTCQRTVAARLRTSPRSVRTWVEQRNRNHVRLGWSAGRRASGTCRVDRDGDVRVSFDRRR